MIAYIFLVCLIIFTILLYKKNNKNCHNDCGNCPFRKDLKK